MNPAKMDMPVFQFDPETVMRTLLDAVDREEKKRALNLFQEAIDAHNAGDHEAERQAVQAFKDRYSIQIELERRVQ